VHANSAAVLPFDDRDTTLRLDALDSGIGLLVRTTHRLFWRAMDKEFAELGITPEMWTYLRVLWREEGLSQREIAERVNLEGPTVGSGLKVMERRGLIMRRRNPKDGREWLIYLKPRGRNLRRKLLPIAEKINAAAMAGIGARQAGVLHGGLQQIQANLRALAGIGDAVDERVSAG
jgi:DNA-binding MarR family transcriptional regulator